MWKSAQIMEKVEKSALFFELCEKREITDPTSYLHV